MGQASTSTALNDFSCFYFLFRRLLCLFLFGRQTGWVSTSTALNDSCCFCFLFRRLLCLFLLGVRRRLSFYACVRDRLFFFFVFPLFVVHFPVLHLLPTANVFVMAFCFRDCFVYSHVFIVNSFISL